MKRTIKQSKIVKAYRALTTLGEINIPLRVSYQVFLLKKTLEPHYLFQVEKEKRTLEALGGIIDKDGTIRFKQTDATGKFKNMIKEIGDLDVEVDFEPITFDINQLEDLRIKANDVECLDGFVNFV